MCHHCESQVLISAWAILQDVCIYMLLFTTIQDWWCTSLSAQWRLHRPGSCPSRDGPPAALHQVPGAGTLFAPPDQMHTWHLGIGQWFCGASVVTQQSKINVCSFFCMGALCKVYDLCAYRLRAQVMIACRFKWFGGTTQDAQMEKAYQHFLQWRKQ